MLLINLDTSGLSPHFLLAMAWTSGMKDSSCVNIVPYSEEDNSRPITKPDCRSNGTFFFIAEHSQALCKVFADNSARLQQYLKLRSLKCKYYIILVLVPYYSPGRSPGPVL